LIVAPSDFWWRGKRSLASRSAFWTSPYQNVLVVQSGATSGMGSMLSKKSKIESLRKYRESRFTAAAGSSGANTRAYSEFSRSCARMERDIGHLFAPELLQTLRAANVPEGSSSPTSRS